MQNDAIRLIHDSLYPSYREELVKEPRQSGICEITKEWVEKGYVVKDSYGQSFIQSEAVRIFTLPSLKNVGFDKGTMENPRSALSLTRFKFAWIVIPKNGEQPELWVGGKYPQKISPKSPFKVRAISGYNALQTLLEDDRAILSIACTNRKELWFNNLRVGDKDTLMVVSEKGCTPVSKSGWKNFKEGFYALPKNQQRKALTTLRGINKGTIEQDSQVVQNFYADNPAFVDVISKHLPEDPRARNFWLEAAGAL